MTDSQSPLDAVTLVISEVVDPHQISEYETWTQGINHAAQEFEGFLGVQVIRPRDHAYPEYVVIVKFANYTYLRNWLTSSVYHTWMEKAPDFLAGRSQQYLPSGLELWFTLPESALPRSAQPAYYKQVILGVVTVYPLILLANAALGPSLKGLPPLLGLLISVTVVSALLTYPVMPWLTRLLNGWLYPTLSKRRSQRRPG